MPNQEEINKVNLARARGKDARLAAEKEALNKSLRLAGSVANSVKRKGIRNTAKTIRKSTSLVGLLKQIRLSEDFYFIPAFFVAILKDLLDYVGVGSLPAIGTVITLCASIFIFMMMLLAGANSKRRLTKMVLRGLILTGGTSAEMLFGVNFLPIESIMMVIIYLTVLIERRTEQLQEKLES